MKRIISFSLVALFVWAFSTAPVSAGEETVPKNIIVFIGDGMGVSHITALEIVRNKTSLDRFRIAGLVMTHAEDTLVTDSAASATAMATGHKTYNGAISVSSGGKPLKTVFEHAEERGMATGLVVTCSVTHATPAAFVAHVDSRRKENEIAEQIVTSGIDVLFGGGWAYFVPRTERQGNRDDGKNLLDALGKRMKVIRSGVGFNTLEGCTAAAALLAPRHLSVAGKRTVNLQEMTVRAIEILSRDEDGFVLMVEGSQIDWASHDNDFDYILGELADFDDAVEAGLDIVMDDGETLVIVTSDHETGGFAVHGGSIEKGEVTGWGFTSGDHTAAMVPIFACGPGSKAFGGILDNTDIGKVLIAYVRE